MPSPPTNERGYIIPIGGGEDKEGDRRIHRRFLELCGHRDARIAVIPTASRLDDTGDRYKYLYDRLGARHIDVLDIRERADAEDERVEEILDQADGVFMTGGNQLRLSTILGGTRLAQKIRRRNAAGMHVAGTSAGAAFLCEHMIAFGSEGPRPVAGKVTLAPGLGLTNRAIIDQHFRQRNRLGRLLTGLAYNPFAHGIGLDEDTAAFIDAHNVMHVVGSGAITVLDVHDLSYSGMAVVDIDEPVTLINVRMHILTENATYDFEAREAKPPRS